MALPYVGSTITLISQAEIRYVGTLHEIDKKKQTVALTNVRSYGTEGRRQDLHIKPRDQTYNLIVFKGEDIKDLNVTQPLEEPSAFKDPAIIAQEETPAVKKTRPKQAPVGAPVNKASTAPKEAPQQPQQQQQQRRQNAAQAATKSKTLASAKKANAAARRKKQQAEQQAKQAAAAKAAKAAVKAPRLPEQKDGNISVKKPSSAEDWASRTAGGRFHPTRLNHRWKPEQGQQIRGRPGYTSGRGGNRPHVSAADANIDIAATSAALEVEKQKFQEAASQADEAPKYDPSNFFDNLGSAATSSRPTAKQPIRRRQNENNALNMQTFGTVPANPRRNTRRFNAQPMGDHHRHYRSGGFYRNGPIMQGSHNRYGAHNRTGHHQYQRSQRY